MQFRRGLLGGLIRREVGWLLQGLPEFIGESSEEVAGVDVQRGRGCQNVGH